MAWVVGMEALAKYCDSLRVVNAIVCALQPLWVHSLQRSAFESLRLFICFLFG